MKLKNLIACATLLATGSVFGAAGIYDSFVFTTTNGAAPLTFYDIGTATINADFDNADLGTFDVGDTLQLGGQQKSWKSGSDVNGHKLYWKVSGGFTGVTMAFQWNQGDLGNPGNLNNPGDQQWGGDVQGGNSSLILSSNVLAGLTPGDYTLVVYSSITTDNAGEISNNNGGADYTATFTVVPEPSAALLGGLGLIGLLRRRRA
jgi:hypothetical protein